MELWRSARKLAPNDVEGIVQQPQALQQGCGHRSHTTRSQAKQSDSETQSHSRSWHPPQRWRTASQLPKHRGSPQSPHCRCALQPSQVASPHPSHVTTTSQCIEWNLPQLVSSQAMVSSSCRAQAMQRSPLHGHVARQSLQALLLQLLHARADEHLKPQFSHSIRVGIESASQHPTTLATSYGTSRGACGR